MKGHFSEIFMRAKNVFNIYDIKFSLTFLNILTCIVKMGTYVCYEIDTKFNGYNFRA